jgi:hypothetical protein
MTVPVGDYALMSIAIASVIAWFVEKSAERR